MNPFPSGFAWCCFTEIRSDAQLTAVIGKSLERVLHSLRSCGPGQNWGGKVLGGKRFNSYQD